jgi:nucleoside phosphorylase
MAAHCLWGLRSWRSSFIPNSTSLRIASYQFSAKSAVISLGTIRKRLSTLTHKDYTIGWISALDSELTAAIAMLDEQHGSLKNDLFDSNTYTLGRIGEHNVVLACLPLGQLGTNSAAAVASQMTRSFDSIRFGLMVGIGGGVPNLGAGLDIRLGDVVVSKPSPRHGGVVQYDFGKTLKGGKFEYSGHLNAPPTVLLTALTKLRAMHALQGFMFTKKLQAIEPLHLQHDFAYPGANHDRLFEANYPHGDRSSCVDCDIRRLVERDIRTSQEPVVHYGLIASGNQVMKDAVTRDRLRDEHGILCFEMEAAGLMNHFPCIVIRGVCDYSDSHKNDRWQTYAAATAAAYAKELLGTISPSHVESTPTLEDIKDIEVMGKSVRQASSEPPRSRPHFSTILDHSLGTPRFK